MKCKISAWWCVYHACMSDDCQKKYTKKNGADFGPGKCETQISAPTKKNINQLNE